MVIKSILQRFWLVAIQQWLPCPQINLIRKINFDLLQSRARSLEICKIMTFKLVHGAVQSGLPIAHDGSQPSSRTTIVAAILDRHWRAKFTPPVLATWEAVHEIPEEVGQNT
jgi:hypothetical protein